jgi:hypothetical protein
MCISIFDENPTSSVSNHLASYWAQLRLELDMAQLSFRQ